MSLRASLARWTVLLGCGVVLATLMAGIVSVLGRALLIVVAAAVLVLVVADALSRWRRGAHVRRFREVYGAAGKDLLIVYTDSPHWQPYIESQWVPRWQHRAVLLNRTRPWSKQQPEAALWSAFRGLEHTPLAIVVPHRGRVRVVRFFSAFRDFKHGKDGRLRAAERDLEAALEASTRSAV